MGKPAAAGAYQLRRLQKVLTRRANVAWTDDVTVPQVQLFPTRRLRQKTALSNQFGTYNIKRTEYFDIADEGISDDQHADDPYDEDPFGHLGADAD